MELAILVNKFNMHMLRVDMQSTALQALGCDPPYLATTVLIANGSIKSSLY